MYELGAGLPPMFRTVSLIENDVPTAPVAGGLLIVVSVRSMPALTVTVFDDTAQLLLSLSSPTWFALSAHATT